MDRYDIKSLEQLGAVLDQQESGRLCIGAARSSSGVRRLAEPRLQSEYRQHFAVDVDRILHSLAYSRYIDKTQVFYLIENDHITHRILHVQLVSRIARTIGRYLKLNEDLIEAIAIGHDIGHPPFGHDGERFLTRICRRHGIGAFHHNVQSVQFLEKVERKGRGWNLCLQTLDGILCHDGEVHNRRLSPDREKNFDIYSSEVEAKKSVGKAALVPMTLEGCVVRFADTISYIGRDVEDAIRLNLIDRAEMPQQSVRCLGDTNGSIVFSLVSDVIVNSYGQPFVAFSPEISEALKVLKDFNYRRIYMNPAIKQHLDRIGDLYEMMFDRFLGDIDHRKSDSPIYKNFINGMADEYTAGHRPEEIVRDFIAGMTDQYFLRLVPPELRPRQRAM